jgi:hypothetical protein
MKCEKCKNYCGKNDDKIACKERGYVRSSNKDAEKEVENCKDFESKDSKEQKQSATHEIGFVLGKINSYLINNNSCIRKMSFDEQLAIAKMIVTLKEWGIL